MSEYRRMTGPSSNSPPRRLGACRRVVGDPRAALRTINHELRSAIPLPASAGNLQEDFPSRLNKAPATIVSPTAVGRRRLRVAIVDGFGIADVFVLVFDIVAGRQDLQQIAAGDLLLGSAGVRTKVLQTPAIVAASPGVALFREPRRRPAGLPPVGTAACARAPAAAAQSLPPSSCFRVVAYFVLYTECGIASIATKPARGRS